MAPYFNKKKQLEECKKTKRRQKSEGFGSCDQPINLAQIRYKLDKLERPFWEYPPQ